MFCRVSANAKTVGLILNAAMVIVKQIFTYIYGDLNLRIMNNIFYNALNAKTYTWNGVSLEEVNNQASFIGSNTFSDDNLDKEIFKAREAAKLLYPEDTNPNIRYARLPL